MKTFEQILADAYEKLHNRRHLSVQAEQRIFAAERAQALRRHMVDRAAQRQSSLCPVREIGLPL